MRAWYPLIATLSLGLTSAACGAPTSPASEILAVMQKSAADWNRGDLAAFARSYKNAADILFIGRSVSRGYAQMLAAYREHYANRAQMGRLSFSRLAVQPLDERFATVTGNYHLRRGKVGGGDADGYFLLVFEKTTRGWKIVRDDSTALPRPARARPHIEHLASNGHPSPIQVRNFATCGAGHGNQGN